VDTEFIVEQPGCLLTASDQIAKNGGTSAGRRIAKAVTCYSRRSHWPTAAITKTFEALMCEKWIKWTDELWVTNKQLSSLSRIAKPTTP